MKKTMFLPLVLLATSQSLQAAVIEANGDGGNTKDFLDVGGYVSIEYSDSTLQDIDPSFRLPELGLFLQKRLGPDWFFFSEIRYENAPELDGQDPNASNGRLITEALHLSYKIGHTAFTAGRIHTPVGLWSVNRYPTVAPSQTKPQHLYNIFPKRIDGAQFMGAFRGLNTTMKYDLFLGNGEFNNGDGDNNSNKALGANFSLLFPVAKRLELGGSYYVDTFENDAEKSAAGAHLRFKIADSEYQGEYAMSEIDTVNGDTVKAEGYYAQVTLAWKKFLFGSRFDHYDDNTKQGAMSSVYGDAANIFVNYRFNNKVQLKMEFQTVDVENPRAPDYDVYLISLVGDLGH